MIAGGYSIGIVAHKDRLQEYSDLSSEVQPDFVSVDDGSRGCTNNHGVVHKALRHYPGWSVILEDDALPLNDFHEDLFQCLQLIEKSRGLHVPVVSLYLGTGYPANWQPRITAALKDDPCFVLAPRLLHAVGYAIHPDHKVDVADWMANGRVTRGFSPEDALNRYVGSVGGEVVYTNPSLVDHADGPPVIEHRPGTFSSARQRSRYAHNTRQRLSWNDSATRMGR